MLFVVCDIMFRRRNRFKQRFILTLHALHKRCPANTCKKRIFPVCLTRSPPARISRNVQVGRPEGKKPVITPLQFLAFHPAAKMIVLGTRFIGNRLRNFADQRGVPARRHPDRLRKHRKGTGAHNAVQRLVSVMIRGNAKTLYGGRRFR